MASIDPSAVGITGVAGLVILMLSKFITRIFRVSNTTLMSNIERLEQDVLTTRAERDAEYKEKMHERKKRIAAENTIQLNNMDFRRFLEKNGLDPRSFKPVTAEKVKRVLDLEES